jgi:colanic acid biosynthesis glycosyl transferase WcaI
MKILIVSNYFYPETVGDGVRIFQLARDLKSRGHEVTVVTSFPSYPAGILFNGYRNRLRTEEVVEGIRVVRTLTWATVSKAFWSRVLGFGCFCASAIIGGSLAGLRADVVFAPVPPLPLGVSAWWLSKMAGANLVVNVVDVYPDLAISLGVLRNKLAIRFFQWLERWIYRHSRRVAVISEGFRHNLLSKCVPDAKIRVVPSWADTRAIVPAPRNNAFRQNIEAHGRLVVLYSGGLTHNTCIEPLLQAAAVLKSESVMFLIVGDGIRKRALTQLASELALPNVKFMPFQPLDRYPEVLAASDLTTVTLNSSATFFSVPSKIYKQMAAGRPILAITEPGNELALLIERSQCGVCVRPNDTARLADVIRYAIHHREEFEAMGQNGRRYVEHECNRERCVSMIEALLAEASD